MAKSIEVIVEQALNKVLATKDITLIKDRDLTESHFPGYEKEFNFIKNHYEKYNQVPDTLTFLDEFPEFNIFQVSENTDYIYDGLFELYTYNNFSKGWEEIRDTFVQSPIDGLEKLKSFLNDIPTSHSHIGINIIQEALSRLNLIVNRDEGEREFFIRTGFDEWDKELNGWSRGEEFVVFFGRTGQGKSWVLLKTLITACLLGNKVGLVSPEMSALKIGYRVDTLIKGFSNTQLTSGRITNDISAFENYKDHIDSLKASGDVFNVATMKDFNRRVTVSKLKDYCISNKLDILGIDGIKYLIDERKQRGDSTATALTNISEDLMQLSCELGIPILVAVQSNRGGARQNEQDGLPEVENIRDSDGISHSASKIFSLRQREQRLEVQIKKNRDGRSDQFFAYYWNPDVGELRFDSANSETPSSYGSTQRQIEAPTSTRRREHQSNTAESPPPERRQRSGRTREF